MKTPFDSAERLLARAFARVRDSTTLPPEGLPVYRILFGLYLLLFELPTFQWIAGTPDAFYSPPVFSLGSLFDGFPGRPVLVLVDVLLVVAVSAITLGVRARWAAFAFVGVFIYATTFKYSFGKVSHPLMTSVFLLCFSATNWGTRHALLPDPPVRHPEIGPALAGVFLCFGMLSAGIPKALGWVDFDLDTSGFLNWLYSGYYLFHRDQLLLPLAFHFPSGLLEIFDYIVVLFECSAFFWLLLGRKYWLGWLLVAASFHLGTTLFFNIHFLPHAVLYLGFASLPGAIQKTTRWRRPFWGLAVVAAIIHLILRLAGHPADFLLVPVELRPAAAPVHAAMFVWIVVLFILAWNVRHHAQTEKLTSKEEYRFD